MRNGLITILAIVGLLSLGLATPSFAITNGGFETGNFSGWDTTGITSVIGSFAGGPTEGTSQARIETGDIDPAAKSVLELETFLGLSAGSLKGLGNGEPVNGSAIKQTFSASLGDVLSFDWNFLTNENPLLPINDFSFVTLLSLSTLGSVTSSTLVPLGGDFNSHTGFQTFSAVIPSPGAYVLGLGVVNVDDDEVSSGLLVDNVTLTGDTSTAPEPGTLLLLGSGLVGLAFWRRQQPA